MASNVDKYTSDWESEVKDILTVVKNERKRLVAEYDDRTKAPRCSREDKDELWYALKQKLNELLTKIKYAQRLALEKSNNESPAYLDALDHYAVHTFELKDFEASEEAGRQALSVRLKTHGNKLEFKGKIESTRHFLLMAKREIAKHGLRDAEQVRLEALELAVVNLDESNRYWEADVRIGLDCIAKLSKPKTRDTRMKWVKILRKYIIILRTSPEGDKLILARLKLLHLLEGLGDSYEEQLNLARDLDRNIRQCLETLPENTNMREDLEQALTSLQPYLGPRPPTDDVHSQSPIHSSSSQTIPGLKKATTWDLLNCVKKINLLFDLKPGDPDSDEARDGNEWLVEFIQFRIKTLENAIVRKSDASQKRVVVTIIDTGIDPSHSYFKHREWNSRPLRGGSVFVERFRDFATDEPLVDPEKKSRDGVQLDAPVDEDGHGTFIAGILFRLVPDIDLRVARIGVKREDIKNDQDLPVKVAKAIDHARETWKTEIIVMSFRCKSTKEVVNAVKAAVEKNILIFAATGNSGRNADLMFPATARQVFKISSTDHLGKVAPSSTPSGNTEFNLSTLGVCVESAWPPSLRGSSDSPKLVCPRPDYRLTDSPILSPEEKQHPTDCKCDDVWAVMSGTSFAAPIAASFAAVIYQFYNKHKSQIKLTSELKTIDAMRAILKRMSVSWKGVDYLRAPNHKTNHFMFIPSARDTAVNGGGKNYDEFFMEALADVVERGAGIYGS